MTKVLQLQYGFSSASPANRLHQAFLEAKIESGILVLYPDKNENEDISVMGKKARLLSRINNTVEAYLTKDMLSKYGKFSYPVIGSDISKKQEVIQADVIYVHWILNGFLSIQSLEKLARLRKPLIFVMHDMWTITGGCHHSFDCNKYTIQCENCQVFDNKKIKDLSYKGFNRKLLFYSKYQNLYFVSPSKWLFDCSQKSALLGSKPLFHIPNIIDKSLFKPFSRNVARQILNIDSNKHIIAFGAMAINSPYKGWEYLKTALNILYELENKEIQIVVFGSSPNPEILDSIPFETRFMGFVDNEYATSIIYNAANVFVAPSLADNLPYTILESLSCGTPVVAFKVGGIPELIDHKKNGYLAEYKNAEDLARGIAFCLKESISGHRLMEFNPVTVMNKHRELIKSVLN
ncbi:Glycosyltransferase involved in cell wall bisynthesis [Salegentibacter holothuriorum]|uniref:Glycosyltransferase involved in cell wall bisynthesis n=1 Tax=Salegentibacter holothuriorum TaxID=241145 RepID=A0A1T5CSC0_9FLAO|nr:glycosyltransferase [Salegentibacter holothuriorum]SKB62070.1 Glycosyltransferase involved in cell wall bisynthesis [Salegentibacter holothuriorum]